MTKKVSRSKAQREIVRPGSHWFDQDAREVGRCFIVNSVDSEFAYGVARGKTGERETRIRLDRFGKAWKWHGYHLTDHKGKKAQ